jgi:hypothetical protein
MKLYIITADMSSDDFIVDIGLVGVFTDKEEADKIYNDCPYKNKKLHEVESDKLYGTMEKRSANKVGFGFSMMTGSELSLGIIEN